jgi:L-lactate utilization protein LutC
LRVGLFVTCVTDTLFPEAGRATVELLERLGQEVVFDAEQACCGQMHGNSGYEPEATALMERFLRVFGDAQLDAIVAPSGSCVAMVREQYPRLATKTGSAELVAQVDALAARTYELTEFLVRKLGVDDVGAYHPHRVVYHPSCHSLRMLELAERTGDYRATVTRCADGPDAIRAAILAAAVRHGVRRLAVPVDLDPVWTAETGLELLQDDAGRETANGLPEIDPQPREKGIEALDGVDGALTGCLLAIAVTGTIVLDTGPGQGRRALTLIPDLHICVVRAEQIVAGVPEAVARMRQSASAGRPLTLISGPSATSDIQLVRVEGVHGPRQLEVIVTTA